MASAPTWWLVITRPSGETNEPDPDGKRTHDFWTCSSHLSSGTKLCFSLRYLVGGLVKSHMPSSARTPDAARMRPSASMAARQSHFVMVRKLLRERVFLPRVIFCRLRLSSPPLRSENAATESRTTAPGALRSAV